METQEGIVIDLGSGIGHGPDRVETRSYESLIVSAVEDQAVGLGVLRPLALGAVEAAASMFARAFAACEVGGPTSASGAVTPITLSSIARQMVRRGESVHLLDVTPAGRLALREVSAWSIEGAPDPATWRYRVTTAGPSSTSTRTVSADAICHPKYSVDPARPWAGRGPLSWASLTGRLGTALEHALADEAAGPRGHLIPVPVDGGDGDDDDPLAELKRDIRGLAGKAALVETTSAGWSEGRAASPRRDWDPVRLGANPPQSLIELRTAIETTVLGVLGVPPVLAMAQGDGTAQREAYRRWLHGSVEPLGRIVEQELSEKLEAAVTLSFRRLEAGDVAGRARAWRSLVGKDAVMNEGDARRLCGLD